MHRRHVQRQGKLPPPRLLLGLHPGKRLLIYVKIQRLDPAAFLQYRDKLIRHPQRFSIFDPSHQHLRTGDPLVCTGNLWLKINAELPVFHRLGEGMQDLRPELFLFFQFFRIQADARRLLLRLSSGGISPGNDPLRVLRGIRLKINARVQRQIFQMIFSLHG